MEILQFKGVRFLMVGAVTTVLDFFAFNVVTDAGLAIIPANLISTSIALVAGFFMHRKIVFEDKTDMRLSQFISFIGFSMFSAYVLQSLVIWVVTNVWAYPLEIADSIAAITRLDQLFVDTVVERNSAKIIAALVTATPNFYTYSKVIFRRPEKNKEGQKVKEPSSLAKLMEAFRW